MSTDSSAPPPADRNAIEHKYATVHGLRLHYAIAGQGAPVLLIHGFPQTLQTWQGVLSGLAQHYTVIAPDYRGAGGSDRPAGGYDKHTMMEDLRGLVQQLGHQQLRVVGHDIGAMIAYRYAAVHPDEVHQLVLMDAPIAGTAAMQQVRAMPKAWHVNFHNARDVAEMLVAGREREYLTMFFQARFSRPNGVPADDIAHYVAAYSAPGAMRAAFELYRAWDQDALHNQPLLASKLAMPVLVLGAESSASGRLLQTMADQIASQAHFALIRACGHWMCEEQAPLVLQHLTDFFATAGPPA